MFSFFKEQISKLYNHFSQKLSTLFNRKSFDKEFIPPLKELLLSWDVGSSCTKKIIDEVELFLKQHPSPSPEQVQQECERILLKQLSSLEDNPETQPTVALFVGINGSGKTTTIGKYAHHLSTQGKKVLIIAGDTFRAAAPQQLEEWSLKAGATIHLGKEKADPSSVVFDGCDRFVKEKFDALIIDTAGRLQTSTPLMNELSKIKRVAQKRLGDTSIATWITLDCTLGQNILSQISLFHKALPLDGLILTKCDSTSKGGIIFAAADLYKLPIVYVTYGEGIEAIKKFDATEYVKALFN